MSILLLIIAVCLQIYIIYKISKLYKIHDFHCKMIYAGLKDVDNALNKLSKER